MELDIALQPKQEQLLKLVEESAATWIGMGGAMGGAKSHGGRAVMLIRRFTHPGTRGLIFRRKKKELIENHIEPLFRQFPLLRSWYNQQTSTINFPNRSALVFGYAEHPAHDHLGDVYDFQGSEWADILVDEATHFNEEELTFLKTRCRWPQTATGGGGGIQPKLILLMNPGGRGHQFVKRILIERRFQGGERPEDYALVRAFGWDNVEWVRAALERDRIPVATYYADFTDQERFHYFVTNSDYGRSLNSLRGKMREAHLMGDWEAFTGQFFDVFDPRLHVVPQPQLEPWWPRWVSIDWGFEHSSAVYWHCQSGDRTITYREFAEPRLSPAALAQAIIDRTRTEEKIDRVYLSWDAFSDRWKKSEDTVERQMTRVLREDKRFGAIALADNDRVGGAMLMYQLLDQERWVIADDCPKLIQALPEAQRDPNKVEDVLKTATEADDCYDSARYGLKSRLSPCEKPVELRVEERIHATDPTSIMIWRSKFRKEEEKKAAPVKFSFRRMNPRQRRPMLAGR